MSTIEGHVPARDDAGDRPSSMTLSARFTAEQHRQAVQAMRVAGLDNVSELVRVSVLAGIHVTAAALEEAQREGFQAAQARAQTEILALEAQLEQAHHDGARWRQLAEQQARRLEITSSHLVVAVIRVLGGDRGGRTAFARQWACLESSEQHRMLTTVATAMAEKIDKVGEETMPRELELRRPRAVFANAAWLIDWVTSSTAEPEIAAAALAQAGDTTASALARAQSSIVKKAGRVGLSASPLIVGWATIAAPATIDLATAQRDRQGDVTDAPQRLDTAPTTKPAAATKVSGDSRPAPLVSGETMGLDLPDAAIPSEANQHRAHDSGSPTLRPAADVDQSQLGASGYGDDPTPAPPRLTRAETAELDPRWRTIPHSEAWADMWDVAEAVVAPVEPASP